MIINLIAQHLTGAGTNDQLAFYISQYSFDFIAPQKSSLYTYNPISLCFQLGCYALHERIVCIFCRVFSQCGIRSKDHCGYNGGYKT